MNHFLIAAGVAFSATVFSYSGSAAASDPVRGQNMIDACAAGYSAGSFRASADQQQEVYVRPYSGGQLCVAGVSQFRTQKKGEKSAMDMWDFLKWRKTLRYTQAEAAEKLGVNRGTIQNWERGVTRISKAAELASQELTRFWKQRPEFGPVALVYSDGPLWQQAEGPSNASVLQCERFLNNDAAIEQASRLKRSPQFINPFIIDKSGSIVWTSPELLRECDRRAKEARAEREAAERNSHNQNTGPPRRPRPDQRGSSARRADKDFRDSGQSGSDVSEDDTDPSDT